jgi:L-threonylcarbamoyladenylate synthase
MKVKMNKLKKIGLALGVVGVIPTDTIYGIVGSALNKKTVERIYKLRRRNPRKPTIVLIGSVADLKKFGVKVGVQEKKILNRIWPDKISVVLPCPSRKFAYLHRGTKTLAFRLPKPHWLRKLLAKTGPLVAPSANWEGKPPAKTIKEAQKYFGDQIDFYIDASRQASKPSTLVKIESGKLTVLRRGAAKIKETFAPTR